jgi:hypothetical protein
VQWDAGLSVSAIGRSLGYSRPTVRKYVEAAERVGLRRGERRRSEATWERLPQELGCGNGMTCWRRLRAWQHSGAFDTLTWLSRTFDDRYAWRYPFPGV